MIHILINLYLISLSAVIIIDVAQFTEAIKTPIKRFLATKKDIRLKPIDCSLCTTFWTGLIYLIAIHSLTIPTLAATLIMAALTQQTYQLIITLQTLIIRILKKIN